MKALGLLLLLVCSLFSIRVLAQADGKLNLRNLSTKEGLPSPEVHCLLEDSQGYMWFGTDNGAARYDGYTVETFGPKEGLANPVILELFEDTGGRIWLSTLSGKTYIWNNGLITPWKFNYLLDSLRVGSRKASILSIEKDRSVLIGDDHIGILRITKNGKVIPFHSKSAKAVSLYIPDKGRQPKLARVYNPDLGLQAVRTQDSLQELGFHTIDLYSKQLDTSFMLPLNDDYQASGHNAALIDGSLLYFSNGEFVEIVNYRPRKPNFIDATVTEIMQPGDGSIYMSCNFAGGLRVYKNVEALFSNSYEQHLTGTSCTASLFDSQGGLWVTTRDQGVFYASETNQRIYDRRSGLRTDGVHTLAFGKGSVFFASETGEVYQMDTSGNQLTPLPALLQRRDFHALHYDSSSETLFASTYALVNGKWQAPQTRNENEQLEPMNSNMYSFLYGSETYLYFFSNSEVAQYNKKTKTVNFTLNRMYNNVRLYASHFANNTKELLIGTVTGLHVFQQGELVPIGGDHPSFRSRIECITTYRDSILIIGTKGQGVTLATSSDTFTLGVEQGLTSDMIEHIYTDPSGVIWISTLSGLNKLTLSSFNCYSIRQFTTSTGLPSNEVYEVEQYGNQLWIATGRGLVKFHEHKVDSIVKPPRLVQVSVGERKLSFLNRAKLAYDENNLQFEWSSISFRQNQKTEYRYRLGPTKAWVHTNDKKVGFTSLRPANYQFTVQAKNQDGYWSQSTTYNFEVGRPWWLSTWFALLLLCAFLLMGILINHWRFREIRKEAFQKRQIEKLEKAALQAQMNPHFLFNCLTSIQNFILQNDKRKAVLYLSKFSKLIRQTLNASVKGRIKLEEEVQLLENYLALEQERFNHSFEYRIEVDPLLSQDQLSFPPMLIQPYVENAVIHGISEIDKVGQIRVSFSREGAKLKVSVQDSGPGILATKKTKKRTHDSVGMSITKQRMTLLNQQPDVVIRSLNQKTDSDCHGTEIIILIKPFEKWKISSIRSSLTMRPMLVRH